MIQAKAKLKVLFPYQVFIYDHHSYSYICFEGKVYK